MKTILFLYNNLCFKLPPFMTILDSLKDEYKLIVISKEKVNSRKLLQERYSGTNVTFLDTPFYDDSPKLQDRIRRTINRKLNLKTRFYKEVTKIVDGINYDLLWVIHESTILEFADYLKGKKYITTLYELNDTRPELINGIKGSLSEALEVAVCEENRAAIIRTWCKLEKTPTVVPNKPLEHPRMKNLSCEYERLLKDKKIIIYQGVLLPSRNLGKICEAMASLKDYTLVLLSPENDYVKSLIQKYPFICHIGFVNPPLHLNITSFAKIAIAKYDYTNLNAVFCAPNKTFEYAGFGIPMLCNDVPGLTNTVGKFKAGICTNLNDVDDIKDAITKIEKDYDTYSRNAVSFYESVDIKEIIRNIVKRNLR